MNALALTSITYIMSGNHAALTTQIDELLTLADEKGSVLWKAVGTWTQAWLCAVSGKSAEAVQMLTLAMSMFRSTGATLFAPTQSSSLADAYAKLGQFDDATRTISEAISVMAASRETWFEAEVNRIAGEIALNSSERDTAKAQAYFERALAVARQQQAKSWELRAAMSMTRLWRDQGKRDEARELLAPVYGWFTEGFDTLDLKEAKALLDELSS